MAESDARAASPCVRRCALHPRERLCVGCGRTGDEIAGWLTMSAAGRREVLAALPGRLATLDADSGR